MNGPQLDLSGGDSLEEYLPFRAHVEHRVQEAREEEREKISRFLRFQLEATMPPWNRLAPGELSDLLRRIRDGDYR